MKELLTFGSRLRASRKAAKLSQAQVATKVGMAQATLSELENDKYPKSVMTPRLAHLYRVNARWLADGVGPKEAGVVEFDQNVGTAEGGARPYPVISYIQAGLLSEIKDPYPPGAGHDVEYGDDDASPWAFFLEIEGESMLPEFRPGDRVRIDPEVAPSPGDFVVARNTREEATFKKYRVRGIDANGNEIFDLVPLNDNYPTLHSDEMQLHVIGTMTEHRRKYRRK